MTAAVARTLGVVAILTAGLALAACTAEPTSSAEPDPTSVAESAPAVTTPTPAAVEPAPEPPQAQVPDTVTAEEAGQLCLDNRSPYGTYVPTGDPVVYERSIEPRWLVHIPGENEHGAGYIECVISDDPAAERPVEIVGEVYGVIVDDEYIEQARNTHFYGL